MALAKSTIALKMMMLLLLPLASWDRKHLLAAVHDQVWPTDKRSRVSAFSKTTLKEE
jgi:hypothetical protein